MRSRFDLADLSRALLGGADLRQATFVEAKLRFAVLDHAKLDGASFAGAKLEGASLHRVAEQGTLWRDADMSNVAKTDAARAKAEDFGGGA